MIGFEVDTVAADLLLGNIEAVVDDDRRLLRLGADLLTDYEERQFATRGRGRWAPLDPATERAKGSGRVLVDTGSLLDELTDPGRARYDGDTVTIGLSGRNAEVAGHLASGARGMPRRDPTPPPDQADAREMAYEMVRLIVGEATR